MKEDVLIECVVAHECPLYEGGGSCVVADTGIEKPCGQVELRLPRCYSE